LRCGASGKLWTVSSGSGYLYAFALDAQI